MSDSGSLFFTEGLQSVSPLVYGGALRGRLTGAPYGGRFLAGWFVEPAGQEREESETKNVRSN